MEPEHVVVVGASAGGIEPLRRVVGGLPPDLNAAVVVVLHLRADSFSALPAILARATHLHVGHAADHEPLCAGHVYVCPPNVHVVVRPGEIRLVHGPTENGHRPAIDPLFRSAAQAYGERVIGIVLSGVLDDGTAGLAVVKSAGGVAVVQSPSDALYPAMPRNAIRRVDVDFVVPSADIGAVVTRLVATDAGTPAFHPEARPDVVQEAVSDDTPAWGLHHGTASGLTCPDCNGALWEVREGGIHKFRCRVGHAWTETGLLAEQSQSLEEALWVALRVVGERADLTRRIHERVSERGLDHVARMLDDRIREFDSDARVLREVLTHREEADFDEHLRELVHDVPGGNGEGDVDPDDVADLDAVGDVGKASPGAGGVGT